MWCRDWAKEDYNNYKLLLIFTACETYFVSSLCQYYIYDPKLNTFDENGYRIAGFACFMTIGVTTAISIYVYTTNSDFTRKMGFIVVFGTTLLMVGISSFFFYNHLFQMFMCALGALLFGLYLVVDTQMIMEGGHHKLC